MRRSGWIHEEWNTIEEKSEEYVRTTVSTIIEDVKGRVRVRVRIGDWPIDTPWIECDSYYFFTTITVPYFLFEIMSKIIRIWHVV